MPAKFTAQGFTNMLLISPAEGRRFANWAWIVGESLTKERTGLEWGKVWKRFVASGNWTGRFISDDELANLG